MHAHPCFSGFTCFGEGTAAAFDGCGVVVGDVVEEEEEAGAGLEGFCPLGVVATADVDDDLARAFLFWSSTADLLGVVSLLCKLFG